MLTPYVLTTDEELKAETERRYLSTDMNKNDWPREGWSDSALRYQSDEDLKAKEENQKNKRQKSNIVDILQNMEAQ